MQTIQTEKGVVYDICFAVDNPPLQVQVSKEVVSKLSSINDCIAALVFWAQEIPDRAIGQIRIMSHAVCADDSVLSIEAYRQPNEPLEEMLFILVKADRQWYYYSPSHGRRTAGLENAASALKKTLSPYLKELLNPMVLDQQLFPKPRLAHFAQQ